MKERSNAVVALIGHPAAGKSSCLSVLNSDRNADMDVALGTTQSPGLDKALLWMTDECRPAARRCLISGRVKDYILRAARTEGRVVE